MTSADLNMTSGTATPAIRDDVLVHAFEGGDALVWGRHPQPVAFDPAGYIVVQILDGEATVDELVADIHEIVGIPESIARSRVEHTLELASTFGLLEGDDLDHSTPPVADSDFLLGPPNN